jgi:hypothetical protein
MRSLLAVIVIAVLPAACRAMLFPDLSPRSDTILAGDSVMLRVSVKDDSGVVHPGLGEYIMWVAVDSLKAGSISARAGDSVVYTSIKAYNSSTVRVLLLDPELSGRIVTIDCTILTVPNAPWTVSVERDSVPTDLRNPQLLDSVTLEGPDSLVSLFAIVRDRYGNYTGPGDSISWTALQAHTVVSLSARHNGSSVVVAAVDSGVCQLVATSNALVADTVTITSKSPGRTAVSCALRTGSVSRKLPVVAWYDLRGRALPRHATLCQQRAFSVGGGSAIGLGVGGRLTRTVQGKL